MCVKSLIYLCFDEAVFIYCFKYFTHVFNMSTYCVNARLVFCPNSGNIFILNISRISELIFLMYMLN